MQLLGGPNDKGPLEYANSGILGRDSLDPPNKPDSLLQKFLIFEWDAAACGGACEFKAFCVAGGTTCNSCCRGKGMGPQDMWNAGPTQGAKWVRLVKGLQHARIAWGETRKKALNYMHPDGRPKSKWPGATCHKGTY